MVVVSCCLPPVLTKSSIVTLCKPWLRTILRGKFPSAGDWHQIRKTVRLYPMMSRIRVVAALCALLALSFAWVEGAWASICAGGMDMEATSAVSAMVDGSEAMPMRDMNGSGPVLPDPDSPQAPHCPFAPLAAAGSCLTTASLPAATLDYSVLSPEGAVLPVSRNQTRHLLLVSSFFRPPRA